MVVFSQCMDCENYIGKKGDAFCCKAFLECIPDAFYAWNLLIHIFLQISMQSVIILQGS